MRFDEENFSRMAELMTENLKNQRVKGNPKINEVMYEFQQNFLPQYLFNSIPKFFVDFRTHRENFFYMMISRIYEMTFNKRFPGFIEDFYCSIEIIDSNYELIIINWDTEQTMLAKRMYIISDLTYTNAAYFLTEVTWGGGLMLCSVGVKPDGSLGRANFGNIPDNENLEIRRILELINK